jgi:Spy/CpxP family protein refolding chaperone
MIRFKMSAAIAAACSTLIFAQGQPAPTTPAQAAPPTAARPTPPPSVSAQGPRPGARFDRSALDLTPEQRTKMEEANKTYSTAATPLYARLTTARRELESLVNADKLDETAVKAKAKEIGDLEGEIAVARAKRFAEFRGFLSPEQARRFNQPTPLARSFQPQLHEGQTPTAVAPNK